MKKLRFFMCFLLILPIFCLFACENATKIRCATISEITAAGSENYGVRVSFQEDSRFKGKITDVQVKFSNLGTISIWKENQPKIDFEIQEIDEWYSLETILSEKDKEKFEKFEDATSRVYLFNFNGQNEVTLRVVVGDKEDNSAGTGEILVGSEPISNQFTLKIK